MLDSFQNFPDVTTEETKVCSINTQATFVIPPLSEILVPATLSARFDANTVGCVEPRHELTERYNIIGAADIVTISEQNTIPIRLLNPTNQPIKIYRWTRLGQFLPAEADIATFELMRSDLEAEAKREIPMPTDMDTQHTLDIDDTELSPEQRTRLRALLQKYNDVFAHNSKQPGDSSVVKHKIDTGNHPPIRLRSYRTSPANKEEIDKQVDEMLQAGIISPSVSPWSFPVVLVRKPDNSMRFCVDYRRLNNITRKDSHPLPRIS